MRLPEYEQKIDYLSAHFRNKLKPSSISDDWDMERHCQCFYLDNAQWKIMITMEVLDMPSGRAIVKLMEDDDWEEQLRKTDHTQQLVVTSKGIHIELRPPFQGGPIEG